jgi:hypothetical protein
MSALIARCSALLLGIVVTAYGVRVEVEIQDQLENARAAGLKRCIVRLWPLKRREIETYRTISRTCVLVGPGLLVLGYGLGVIARRADRKG